MYQDLLARLARALDTARIPYMVIGGQAVLLHGEPRLTRDVDVTLGVDAGELKHVLATVTDAGFPAAIEDPERFVHDTNVLPLLDAPSAIRVDLIFSFSPYEAEAIARAVTVVFDRVPVRFAAVEDLLIHKMVAGRPRDIEDVAGILRRKPTLDLEYLLKWLVSFREVLNRDLVSEFKAIQASLSPS
jgi:hypothetical protein